MQTAAIRHPFGAVCIQTAAAGGRNPGSATHPGRDGRWRHCAPGGAVLPEALRYFERARRMLDESDYTEAVGRELLIVTADLGIESAWFAHDADNQPLARRLYEEAALLAESGGDSRQRV